MLELSAKMESFWPVTAKCTEEFGARRIKRALANKLLEKDREMLVFTEEWRLEMKNAYKTLKKHEWPSAYCVAMKDRFGPVRKSIEAWVADQSKNSQAKLIKYFQSPKEKDRFLHTYHDLVVGSLLKALGLQTEYERKINGKTPDWYVSTGNMSHHFIVEVFTKNTSDLKVRWDAWVANLNDSLRLIPFNIRLELSPTQLTEPPDSDRNTEITWRIKTWLEQKPPRIGDQLPMESLMFEVSDCGSPFRWVRLYHGDFLFVNPTPIKRSILDKIKSYEDLIKLKSIPLVVAVVAGPGALYEAEELETAIYGRDTKDGIFASHPLLTGVIWASGKNLAEWEMKSWLNPHAQNPLPESIFENNSPES